MKIKINQLRKTMAPYPRSPLKFLTALVLGLIACSLLSCIEGQGAVSSRVAMTHYPDIPIVHLSGEEQEVICRRGLPLDYIPPWIEPDDGANTEAGREDNVRQRELKEKIEGPWFSVSLLFDNTTPFHLVVNTVIFRVELLSGGFGGGTGGGSGGSGGGSQDQSFTSGSYCETDPLFWFEPHGSGAGKSFITHNDVDKGFHRGNLKFYIPGPSLEESQGSTGGGGQGSGGAAGGPIPFKRVPSYRVHWYAQGQFKQADGNTVAEFQRRGSFTTRPVTF